MIIEGWPNIRLRLLCGKEKRKKKKEGESGRADV